MTGTVTFEQDATRLNEQVSAVKAWLLGTGATDGQCKDMLRVECGQLAWGISQALGPSTLAEGKKGVERDVSEVFFPLTAREPFEGNQQGHSSDLTWLFAYGGGSRATGTAPSFLVGAKTEDVRLYADDAEMKSMFYKASRSRGKVWEDLGEQVISTPGLRARHNPWRGHQHAIRINRIVVSTAAYKALVRNVEAVLGQMRATFAATAARLAVRKRIPEWVRKQIANVEASGKTIFNDVAMNHPTDPRIEFGSHAIGVESNPVVRDKIHDAFSKRSFIMAKKLKDLAKGAAYVWSTGQTYFPKASDE